MKKRFFFLFGIIVAFISCVSLNDREMNANERASTQVIGSVTAEFTSFQFFHFPSKNGLRTKAYTELMRAAKREYEGNVDIKNITISGRGSVWEAAYIGGSVLVMALSLTEVIDFEPAYAYTIPLGLNLIGNFQKITATGDVVLAEATQAQQGSLASRPTGQMTTGIEGALARAAEQTLLNVPQRSRIAIVFITAEDRSTTDFITGELEFIWVNGGYIITDRSELDRLRREQNFQLSGEVDDATAVSIGRFAGADIIVTGRVDGEGNLRRLRLRAINTQSAQVVGVASERL